MSATQLALAIVITVTGGFVILMAVSMIVTAWERSKLNPVDPRTDEELARDVRRALRRQERS